ncbi:MAG: hypothetical protein JJE52_04550 [Acidimicrobiia bacterium]|nr:hypothetical protein [Acidimicrobiia bacterium]
MFLLQPRAELPSRIVSIGEAHMHPLEVQVDVPARTPLHPDHSDPAETDPSDAETDGEEPEAKADQVVDLLRTIAG